MCKFFLLPALFYLVCLTNFSFSQDYKVEIKLESKDIPDSSGINKYPNPFCPATDFKFNIREKSNVVINLYNGEMDFITTLWKKDLEPGKYEIKWDASSIPSGVYHYELLAGQIKDIKKIVFVK